jgi:hypothetical protein
VRGEAAGTVDPRPGVEKNIALGLKLLALRATIKSNCAFRRRVRRQFEVDAKHAAEVMKVARLYGPPEARNAHRSGLRAAGGP